MSTTDSTPYDVHLSRSARRALEQNLPSAVAFAAWAFINGPLRDNPRRVGKPLRLPFEGTWAARRGSYRIRYEIDEAKRIVRVLDIAGRADAYHSARANQR